MVSVLVTVYNREAYLAEALSSILQSQFSDFEVLVVDNSSSDASLSIARDFEATDQRVRVVANVRNLGQFENRTRAASLARVNNSSMWIRIFTQSWTNGRSIGEVPGCSAGVIAF